MSTVEILLVLFLSFLSFLERSLCVACAISHHWQATGQRWSWPRALRAASFIFFLEVGNAGTGGAGSRQDEQTSRPADRTRASAASARLQPVHVSPNTEARIPLLFFLPDPGDCPVCQ